MYSTTAERRALNIEPIPQTKTSPNRILQGSKVRMNHFAFMGMDEELGYEGSEGEKTIIDGPVYPTAQNWRTLSGGKWRQINLAGEIEVNQKTISEMEKQAKELFAGICESVARFQKLPKDETTEQVWERYTTGVTTIFDDLIFQARRIDEDSRKFGNTLFYTPKLLAQINAIFGQETKYHSAPISEVTTLTTQIKKTLNEAYTGKRNLGLPQLKVVDSISEKINDEIDNILPLTGPDLDTALQPKEIDQEPPKAKPFEPLTKLVLPNIDLTKFPSDIRDRLIIAQDGQVTIELGGTQTKVAGVNNGTILVKAQDNNDYYAAIARRADENRAKLSDPIKPIPWGSAFRQLSAAAQDALGISALRQWYNGRQDDVPMISVRQSTPPPAASSGPHEMVTDLKATTELAAMSTQKAQEESPLPPAVETLTAATRREEANISHHTPVAPQTEPTRWGRLRRNAAVFAFGAASALGIAGFLGRKTDTVAAQETPAITASTIATTRTAAAIQTSTNAVGPSATFKAFAGSEPKAVAQQVERQALPEKQAPQLRLDLSSDQTKAFMAQYKNGTGAFYKALETAAEALDLNKVLDTNEQKFLMERVNAQGNAGIKPLSEHEQAELQKLQNKIFNLYLQKGADTAKNASIKKIFEYHQAEQAKMAISGQNPRSLTYAFAQAFSTTKVETPKKLVLDLSDNNTAITKLRRLTTPESYEVIMSGIRTLKGKTFTSKYEAQSELQQAVSTTAKLHGMGNLIAQAYNGSSLTADCINAIAESAAEME